MKEDKHNTSATSSSASNGALAATGGSTAAVGAAGAAAGGATSSNSAVAALDTAHLAAMLENHGHGRARKPSNSSNELYALAVALRAAMINQAAPGAATGTSSRPDSAGAVKVQGPPDELPSATASVAAPATDQTSSSAASAGTPSLSGRSRGGWSSTGGSCTNVTQQRSRALRVVAPARSQSNSRPGSRAGSRLKTGGTGASCSTSAPLPRLLVSSASMPCVLAADRDLSRVRDEYYGGDDLLMHEDILHCSNPRLFPLEPNRINKPFRLENLVVC